MFGNVTREKAPAAGSIERRGGRTRSVARVGTPIELSLQWMENREAWADEPTSDHLCSEIASDVPRNAKALLETGRPLAD